MFLAIAIFLIGILSKERCKTLLSKNLFVLCTYAMSYSLQL